MLAQEQSVICKSEGQEETQGTLLLTSKRLLFVTAREEEHVTTGGHMRYADIDDLKAIPKNPSNLDIALPSITRVVGHRGAIKLPRLRVRWSEERGTREVEFEQQIIGGRSKNLSDWAQVIEGLKTGSKQISIPTSFPSKDTTEGKVFYVLGDMQEKGVFQIEEELEKELGVKLDSDSIESACKELVKLGLLDEQIDPSGDVFYKKRSPLGEDDLSS